VLVAFIASAAFIVLYTTLAPWWRSSIGRALVMLDAGLALTLAPAVLHRFFGLALAESLLFAWYFLITLTVVAGAVVWRTVIMVREQLAERSRGRRRRR
jgi:hypothetical protein